VTVPQAAAVVAVKATAGALTKEVVATLEEVASVEVEAAVDRRAIRVVESAICLVTALKEEEVVVVNEPRSATTVARPVIFPATVHLRQARNASATSASNLAMSSRPAPTRRRARPALTSPPPLFLSYPTHAEICSRG